MILAKKGTKNFTTPYLIPFRSVSHENKALHNFHKSGLHPVVGCIKSLLRIWIHTLMKTGSYRLGCEKIAFVCGHCIPHLNFY